jgi:uncharacterized membrane protein
MAPQLLHSLLAITHVLAGAAWLGAMFYSFFLLQPRAQAYFAKPAEFEDFIATVSHGARWKVIFGLAVIGGTGLGLVLLRWPGAEPSVWLGLLGLKVVLFGAAVGLFIYVSWRFWPARVLALPEEIPYFQRLSRRLGFTMMTLGALAMALGVLAHCW